MTVGSIPLYLASIVFLELSTFCSIACAMCTASSWLEVYAFVGLRASVAACVTTANLALFLAAASFRCLFAIIHLCVVLKAIPLHR